MMSDSQGEFDPEVVKSAGIDVDPAYFTGYACRMAWTVYWDMASDSLSLHYSGNRDQTGIRGDHDRIRPFHLEVIKAFNAAEPFMFNRMVLPGGNGFMYQQGATRILWSTADAEHDLGGSAMVTDLMSGAVHNTARLKSGRLRVYQISKM